MSKPTEWALKSRSTRSTQIIIVVLVVALVISTLFTIRQRRRVLRTEAVNEALQLAEKNLQSAESLLDLNNVKARALLEESEQRLESVSIYNIKDQEIDELTVKIQALFDKVAKINRQEPQLLYDFSVQGEGVSLVDAAYVPADKIAFAADKGRNYIYELNVDSNPSVENLVADISRPILLVSEGTDVYVLTEGGFSSINVDDSSLSSDILDLPSDKVWAALSLYLDNIYLLSSTDSQIYKFAATDSGYSASSPWLEEEIDLTSAVAMSIDGNVFVLSRDGTVYKFAAGKKEEFTVSNLDKPFEQLTDITTTVDSRYLYILDAGNKRIVVLDKDGRYQEQYLWESNLGGCEDVLLDEPDNVVYLRCGNSIYSIALTGK